MAAKSPEERLLAKPEEREEEVQPSSSPSSSPISALRFPWLKGRSRRIARFLASSFYAVDIFSVSAVVFLLLLVGHAVYCIPALLDERFAGKKWGVDAQRQRSFGIIVNYGAMTILFFASWIFKVKVMARDEATGEKRFVSVFSRWKVFPLGRHVVMSNHLSNMDGFILRGLAAPVPMKTTFKSSLAQIPFVGWSLAICGDTSVHFTQQKGGWGTVRTDETMRQSARTVNSQCPLLVFPEGTRRKGHRMAPFRRGFFAFAQDHKVPILPAAIHDTDVAWPAGSSLVNFATVHIAFAEKAIEPSGTLDEFQEAVRDEVISLVKCFPTYDAELEVPFASLDEFKAAVQMEKHRREVQDPEETLRLRHSPGKVPD